MDIEVSAIWRGKLYCGFVCRDGGDDTINGSGGPLAYYGPLMANKGGMIPRMIWISEFGSPMVQDPNNTSSYSKRNCAP